MSAGDDRRMGSRIKRKKDEIRRLAETIRQAREIAASIDSDRVTSSLLLDEQDCAVIEIAADLVFLEQRLAELTHGALKDSASSEQGEEE